MIFSRAVGTFPEPLYWLGCTANSQLFNMPNVCVLIFSLRVPYRFGTWKLSLRPTILEFSRKCRCPKFRKFSLRLNVSLLLNLHLAMNGLLCLNVHLQLHAPSLCNLVPGFNLVSRFQVLNLWSCLTYFHPPLVFNVLLILYCISVLACYLNTQCISHFYFPQNLHFFRRSSMSKSQQNIRLRPNSDSLGPPRLVALSSLPP